MYELNLLGIFNNFDYVSVYLKKKKLESDKWVGWVHLKFSDKEITNIPRLKW